MDEQTVKLIRGLTADLIRYASSAARGAELEKQLEQLRTDHDNVGLANVGLSKAYQKNLEELDALKAASCGHPNPGYCPHCGRGDCSPTGEQYGGLQDELKALQDQLTAAESDRDGLREERDEARRRLKENGGYVRGVEDERDALLAEVNELRPLRAVLNVQQGLLKSVAERLEKREQLIFQQPPAEAKRTLRDTAHELGEIYREIDRRLSEVGDAAEDFSETAKWRDRYREGLEALVETLEGDAALWYDHETGRLIWEKPPVVSKDLRCYADIAKQALNPKEKQ